MVLVRSRCLRCRFFVGLGCGPLVWAAAFFVVTFRRFGGAVLLCAVSRYVVCAVS